MEQYRIRFAFLVSILLVPVIPVHSQIFDPIGWEYQVEKGEGDVFELVITSSIEQGWHLYSQDLPDGGPVPTSFHFESSDKYELIGPVSEVTKAEEKFDPSFGLELKMFSNQAVFMQKFRPLILEDFQISGFIEFMSCDDERCLPPREVEFGVTVAMQKDAPEPVDQDLPVQKELNTAVVDQTGTENASVIQSPDQDSVIYDPKTVESVHLVILEKSEQEPYGQGSLWGLFFMSFLLGFAGVLTPCVYPMIPMTVSFFMQGSETKGKAIGQALVFGISIVAIYTLVGLIISLTSAGANFANVLSTHWIPNLIFFLLFLFFAASFLGMFEIVLPSSLTNSADRQADRGGFVGAFFMALTLALVSFSCTGPIVGYLLVQAATGEVIEPLVGMFGFSLAFALPFTLLAFSPNLLKNLPKSGGWLNSVKVVMGFVILAFGFKFLSNIDQTYHLGILSRDLYLSIWIVLVTILGFYLMGKVRFAHDSELPHLGVGRLALAIASFTFAVYMVPGLFGAPLKGISGLIPPQKAQQFDLSSYNTGGQPIASISAGSPSGPCGTPKYADLFELPYGLLGYYDYEQGMACARELNKPVLLDFKGHACSNCKEMETRVWSDPEVLRRLREDFVIIALYTDDKTRLPEEEWVTSSYDGKVKDRIGKKNADFQITHFQSNTQPFYVIVDHNGDMIWKPYAYDLNISNYVEFLENGKTAYYNKYK